MKESYLKPPQSTETAQLNCPLPSILHTFEYNKIFIKIQVEWQKVYVVFFSPSAGRYHVTVVAGNAVSRAQHTIDVFVARILCTPPEVEIYGEDHFKVYILYCFSFSQYRNFSLCLLTLHV